MKQFHRSILPLLFGAIFALVGCTKDSNVTTPTSGSAADELALKAQVASDDTVAQFSSSDEATIDDDGMKSPEFDDMVGPTTDVLVTGTLADSTYPVRWGRRIDWRNVTHDYHVVIQGDTLAFVTIQKHLPGNFLVGWGIHTPDTTIIDTVIKKPFIEHVTRRVTFKRIARHDDARKNWIPVAISMVQGQTDSVNSFAIVSVEVSENRLPYDQTFTDPLNTWFRFNLLHGMVPILPANDSVTVRVTVSSSDSAAEFVFLRAGIGGILFDPHRGRAMMHLVSTSGSAGNYTRVYERSFHTALPRWAILAARFNAVVDVMSNGSIYDTAASFSNEFWGIPYVVVRTR